MELSKKELEIFEKINLYERHSNLSNQHSFEDGNVSKLVIMIW